MFNLLYIFLAIIQYGSLPFQILSTILSTAILIFLIFNSNEHQTLKALILSTILFDDITRTEGVQLLNINTISFMSLSILELLTFLFFIKFGFINHKIQVSKPMVPWIIILSIGLISSIINLNFPSYDKFLFKILVLLLLTSGFYKYFKKINPKEIFTFFILVIAIKAFINIMQAIFGYGVELGGGEFIRGNYATSKNLMHIPLVAFTVSLFLKYKVKNLPIYALLATISMFSYSSRGNLFLTFIIIALIILRYGIFTKDIRNFYSLGSFFIVCIATSFLIFNVLFPGLGNYTYWKITTIFVNDLTVFGSTQARIFEIINIYHSLLHQNSIIYGVGWGGHFTDTFMPYINNYWDKSTYPLSVFETGEIYHPHGMLIEVFLKTGILGLAYYLLYCLNFIISAMKKTSSPEIIIISLSIIPIILKLNSYTTIFTIAILLASLAILKNQEIKNEL